MQRGSRRSMRREQVPRSIRGMSGWPWSTAPLLSTWPAGWPAASTSRHSCTQRGALTCAGRHRELFGNKHDAVVEHRGRDVLGAGFWLDCEPSLTLPQSEAFLSFSKGSVVFNNSIVDGGTLPRLMSSRLRRLTSNPKRSTPSWGSPTNPFSLTPPSSRRPRPSSSLSTACPWCAPQGTHYPSSRLSCTSERSSG